MKESFPLDLENLSVEVFGFPEGQNCTIVGDGFVCDGEYPLVFSGELDDDGFELVENTWHSDPAIHSEISRMSATYEVLFTSDALVNAEARTATFAVDGGILSSLKSYAVHLYYDGEGKVRYSDQEEGDDSDFHAFWIFTTEDNR